MTMSRSRRTSSSCVRTTRCSCSRARMRRRTTASASDACCTWRRTVARWRARASGAPASSRASWWRRSRPTSSRSSRARSLLLPSPPPAPHLVPRPRLPERERAASRTRLPSGSLSCEERSRVAAKGTLLSPMVCSFATEGGHKITCFKFEFSYVQNLAGSMIQNYHKI